MPRRHRYEPLNVYVNGRKLGQLRREPSGAIEFEYDALAGLAIGISGLALSATS